MDGDDVRGGVTHRTNGFLLEPDEPRDPPELAPEEVLTRLEAAGLTGMGGAGFPTHRKWDAVRREPGPRVVIVNADEGEPGTIKDRYVMELRPHLLLEGLVAAMRFCEVDEAYVYLREEYATSRARLHEAIAERGLNVHVVVGAGSYVCGEESAMLESMEGRRGMPRLRPPFPAQKGYLGRPTLINNVETLVHVARILRGEWQPGRLWSVSGAVREPGCFEAPLDVTARQLVDGSRGRLRPRRSGLSSRAARRAGSCRPRRSTSRSPVTRCASGGAARVGGRAGVPGRVPGAPAPGETMRFFAEESCQKCTPVPDRQPGAPPRGRGARARPRRDDREKVDEWLEAMAQTSICGLGQASPIPVRNVVRHWPELMETLG